MTTPTIATQGTDLPDFEDRFVRLNLEIMKVERVATDSRSLVKLLLRWGLHSQPQECFWVIAYDISGHLRSVTEVARGGHAEVDIHIPSVMTAVLSAGAVAFSVAHNHPPLSPRPSVADHELNLAIMEAANACGLLYEEHVIVEPNGSHFSFRDSGLLIPAPRGSGAPLNVSKASPVRGQ